MTDAEFVLRILAEGGQLVLCAGGALLTPKGGAPSVLVPDGLLYELITTDQVVLDDDRVYRLAKEE